MDCSPGPGQSLEWRSVSGYFERSRQRIFFQTDIVFYSYSPQYLGADVVMIVEAGDLHTADHDMPSFGLRMEDQNSSLLDPRRSH